MLYNSQSFILFFLPFLLLIYYRRPAFLTRADILLAASLVFYSSFDIRFLIYLLVSILLNWLIAFSYSRNDRKIILNLGIALNILCLGFYKYTNFFLGNLAAFNETHYAVFNILVPLGISFITFEHISYLIDLKKGSARIYPLKTYALYISFFPHLIAGPIVRHYELMPQILGLNSLPKYEPEKISRGLVLFIIGLSKKVLIADQVAVLSNALFAKAASGATLNFSESWLAALSFGVQVYFDFSGYTDMALGLALMFGLSLPENFNKPYAATSISDFWRRWHMTLSRLLRDYIYIPLGGSRNGFPVQVAALMATMLLCGLWHGAKWTFVVWGAWHGILLVINAAWKKSGFELPGIIGWLLTFAAVSIGWILFRAETFTVAESMIGSMIGLGDMAFDIAKPETKKIWIVAIGLLISIWGPTAGSFALEKIRPSVLSGIAAAAILVYIILEIGKGRASEFIYFQF